MYGLKVRKQYAKLYKEALQKLATNFGISLPTEIPTAPTPPDKGK